MCRRHRWLSTLALLFAPLSASAQPEPSRAELPITRLVLYSSGVGYYLREGKHSMTADDWRVFMDFADRQWTGHR